MKKFRIVLFTPAGSTHVSNRFCVVDANTGKILDDAHGYGYATKRKAYSSWMYKSKPKAEKIKIQQNTRNAQTWLKTHPDFKNIMDQRAAQIESTRDQKNLDIGAVSGLLKSNHVATPFTAWQILRAWEKQRSLFSRHTK